MAWYNSFKDLLGDVGSVAKNPIVDVGLGLIGTPALAGLVNGVGQAASGMSDSGNSVTDANGNPVSDPNATGGGGFDWGKFLSQHGADILKTGGAAATGIADYSQKQAQLKQQADQFNKTYGLQNNAQQMQASRALNAAPLTDQGMYLAQHYTAPTPFQPRDITKGVSSFQQPATGGAAAQLAANSAAAANYKAGDGGYDTSTLKAILAKVAPTAAPQASTAPQGVAATSPAGTTRTVNYGGQQFSPQDWETYKQQNNLQGYA